MAPDLRRLLAPLSAAVMLVGSLAMLGAAVVQPPATTTSTAPSPAAAEKPELHHERDIVYATRAGASGQVELKMNMSSPARAAGEERRPCIVVIHGGGWAAGKREDLDRLTRFFAEHGWVSATISYRFAPAERAPAQINDCAEAVRFLRTNAERFGIDPGRIGAMGFSAGAHLAMLLAVGDAGDGLGIEATTPGGPSGKVQAAVSVVGPTLLNAADIPQVSKGIVDGLVGPDPEGRDERCVKASPLTYVNKGDPPMLLFQGTADPLVPTTQATLMAEAMAKAGVPGRVEIIIGARHGWAGPELERTLNASFEFYTRVFGSQEK